jgi:hypothetical protein
LAATVSHLMSVRGVAIGRALAVVLAAVLASACVTISTGPSPAPSTTPSAIPSAEPTATPTTPPTAPVTEQPTAPPTATPPTATQTPKPTKKPTPQPTATDQLDYHLDPNFGTYQLQAGFSNDPYPIDMIAGGDIDASYLGGGCSGMVTAAPDVRVIYDGTSPTGLLRFYFQGSGDATLIVNDPQGTFWCNDDYSANTVDPGVDLINVTGTLGEDQFDVWVGSYIPDEAVIGTLYVTELNSNHP